MIIMLQCIAFDYHHYDDDDDDDDDIVVGYCHLR